MKELKNEFLLILFGILLIINLIILIKLIKIISNYKKTEKNEQPKPINLPLPKSISNSEIWDDLYGTFYPNILYSNGNNIIINTYGKNGRNYNNLVNINNDENYEITSDNYYDMFVPYIALKRKNKKNGIFLYIHGGYWTSGSKNFFIEDCAKYAKFGFITATMDYTLLSENNKKSSIYRILDEIDACIFSIKTKLHLLGFDVNKLYISLSGLSAGAHLSLLYSMRRVNDSPIKIKFAFNFVGPLNLEKEVFKKLKNYNETLECIEEECLNEALKEGKIIQLYDYNRYTINFLNMMCGHKYNNNELDDMLFNNGSAKLNDERIKFLINDIAKDLSPVNFINENSIPVLMEFGGNDNVVGIGIYASIKKFLNKFNVKYDLVYSRYAGHLLNDRRTENGISALRDFHYLLLKYANDYFQLDKDNAF